MMNFDKLDRLNEKYPKLPVRLEYGTAGFRAKSANLAYVTFRIGIIAALRSKQVKQEVGLMITASHNPEDDNGIKLIDPNGEMLEKTWEIIATEFVNMDIPSTEGIITRIASSQKIDEFEPAKVMIGRDTRSSSPKLSEIAIETINTMGGFADDWGIVTTPMLHFFVCHVNLHPENSTSKSTYYSKLKRSFKSLCNKESPPKNYIRELGFDGANGVGAIEMKQIAESIDEYLQIDIYNDNVQSYELLNKNCGADYVKVKQIHPDGVPVRPNKRYVSVDGDVDRLIYYYTDENDRMNILDGDKIAALIASYLMDLVKKIGWNLKIGVVQTAYANGNSTKFISEILKIPVSVVETGVKHLHAKAKEYDIGIYFEANGHGTILFSQELKQRLKNTMESSNIPDEEKYELHTLATFINLINENVGDAFSDLLAVEYILRSKNWNIQDWNRLYIDLPNRLRQVRVKDKSAVVTTDAGRRCVKPENLQREIDNECKKYQSGRSFVRPSGTEDVVRVFAEADTQSNADTLAVNVAKLVYNMANGVGNIPQL